MKLLTLLILLVVSLPVRSQEPTPANEKELKRQRQRTQAISMVEQTAAEAPLWDDKKPAVEALTDAADLLWDQLPGQAEKWLTKAWYLIDQVSESPQTDGLREFVRRSQRTDLQTAVLRVAQAHDAKLADKFIAQLTQKEPEEKKNRGAFDDKSARSEQFLKLAQQTVDTNPELAFSLAQRSLADGLSFTLQNVLTSLRRKNVELSNRLFDLALARFSSSVPDPSEAEVLAGYLFLPGITFSSSADGRVIMSMNPLQRTEPAVALSEPQRAREFLVVAYRAFFTQPISLETPEGKQRALKIWVFGNRNAGRYNTLAPEFAVPAKAYLTQLQSQLYPNSRADPFSASRQGGTNNDSATKPQRDKDIYEARIAELEDQADKEADPAAKKIAYINAALATDTSDYQHAKRIAEKIADETLRADVISFVLYRAALAFVKTKEMEKASELASQISDAGRRAVVKIAIAQTLLASKPDDKAEPDLKVDQQRAFDLLTDVEGDLRKEEPSRNAAKILLGRTALLAKLDKDQGLIALEQAVQIINKLDRFDLNDGSAPKLGISVSARSENLANTPRIGFNFQSAIASLITTEFENLADLTGRLKTKEVRGVARLEVAGLYLQKNK